jgi:hypothetical protein
VVEPAPAGGTPALDEDWLELVEALRADRALALDDALLAAWAELLPVPVADADVVAAAFVLDCVALPPLPVIDASAPDDALLPAFAVLPPPGTLAPADALAAAFADACASKDGAPGVLAAADTPAPVSALVLADAAGTPLASTPALADALLLAVALDDEEPMVALPDAVAEALADAFTETPGGADMTSANARLIVWTLVTTLDMKSRTVVMLRAIAPATAWMPAPVTVVTLRATDPVTVAPVLLFTCEKLCDEERLTVCVEPEAPLTVMLLVAVAVFWVLVLAPSAGL